MKLLKREYCENSPVGTISLVEPKGFSHIKDPCIVFDGRMYHLFGTGAKGARDPWEIAHFTAIKPQGPWTEAAPSEIRGMHAPRACAPGVVYDKGFHLFIHTDCFELGGTIEYAFSPDGSVFTHVNTALTSAAGAEAGIYDAHPALVERNGKKEHYLTYSGMPRVGHGDIYLARASSWRGPWERLGCILRHEEVQHHNQHADADYEWGLEGAQVVQLPEGFLLNAVCFLPEKPFGSRQRVFFAFSRDIAGPYTSLGPMLTPPSAGWDSAENGHASVLVQQDLLHLFYQARAAHTPWRYGLLSIRLEALQLLLPIVHTAGSAARE
jgi:hypothetical protein